MKREKSAVQGEAPFHSPFDALRERRASLPPGPERPTAIAADPEVRGPARAVLRLQRKGHGGKEVTAVEKLGLNARELERWLVDLKRQLGCGGSIDGDALIFQGDQRARLEPLLAARGVRKVIAG